MSEQTEQITYKDKTETFGSDLNRRSIEQLQQMILLLEKRIKILEEN